jgi:hypothetical protein
MLILNVLRLTVVLLSVDMLSECYYSEGLNAVRPYTECFHVLGHCAGVVLLSIDIPSDILLSAVMVSVSILSVVMLRFVMLREAMLNAVLPSIAMLSIVMLYVAMLSIVTLNVVLLSIAMLSTVASKLQQQNHNKSFKIAT